MTEVQLEIDGMACDGCAERLQGVLAAGTGVRSAQVSFANARAIVRFNEHAITLETIREIVRRAGFEVVDG